MTNKKIKSITIGEYEYECSTHDSGKKLSEIEIPKGWQLWTYEDWICSNDN